MYLRIAEPQIRTALRDTRVVAISGPRQSGKTTLARRFAKQGRKYVTLDNQSTLAAAKSDPVAFIRGLDRAVIDEVQGLLPEAHESDLSLASEVTQARVTEALTVGAETYEGELQMDYLSRLSH